MTVASVFLPDVGCAYFEIKKNFCRQGKNDQTHLLYSLFNYALEMKQYLDCCDLCSLSLELQVGGPSSVAGSPTTCIPEYKF